MTVRQKYIFYLKVWNSKLLLNVDKLFASDAYQEVTRVCQQCNKRVIRPRRAEKIINCLIGVCWLIVFLLALKTYRNWALAIAIGLLFLLVSQIIYWSCWVPLAPLRAGED